MYKGPASGWKNKLGRLVVCAFTLSRYSHVELVIDGYGYSSSFMDGGVRRKMIDFSSGHWDLYPAEVDVPRALARFAADKGKPYDWPGMLRVCPLLRWLPRSDGSRFCSEMVAWMLGAEDPETYSPEDVLEGYADQF